MIVAIPVASEQATRPLAADLLNAAGFALRNQDESFLPMDLGCERDIARTLIAHDVSVLITPQISLEAFVLLKTYGVRVYAAQGGDEASVWSDFEAGTLREVKAADYPACFGRSHAIFTESALSA